MQGGVLQHVGRPQNIYQRPANEFVATFIGRSNILDAHCVPELNEFVLEFDGGYKVKVGNLLPEAKNTDKVRVSVRPEEFIITEGEEGIPGTVRDSVFLGLNTHYFITLENGREVETISESELEGIIRNGSRVRLKVKANKINVFNADGSMNLTQGVVNDVK